MPAPAVAPDVATLEELLVQMWRIRAFETRAMQLFEEKLIRGSVHPYIGMEAIAVEPATIASAPSMLWSIAVICMLPPLPRQ